MKKLSSFTMAAGVGCAGSVEVTGAGVSAKAGMTKSTSSASIAALSGSPLHTGHSHDPAGQPHPHPPPLPAHPMSVVSESLNLDSIGLVTVFTAICWFWACTGV